MNFHQTATQIFVEQLTCPICFEIFEDRVLQCSLGHSVCEGCHTKQLNSECVQCRQPFIGTRNFLLEEMVKQLKRMKYTAAATSSSQDTAATSEIIKKHLTEQLSEQLAKLFDAVPKPKDILAAVVDETMVPRIVLEDIMAAQIGPVGPGQPRGLFSCRMLNCTSKLPSCRILNHIRSLHPSNLTEHRLENERIGEFVTRYEFKCGHFRRAIRVMQWGLFFLIINIKRESNKTIVTAWVQCVGRNEEAKWFKFDLNLLIANHIVSYEDYVYGETSDAAYIETKNQCLTHETAWGFNRIGDIVAESLFIN